jgi:5-methylthioadenosine/S-adenosylhomocysteine deaminase
MRTILKNATLITMDAGRRVLPDHVLVIEGNRITAICRPTDWLPKAGDEVIDLRGHLILPGLVNTHVHVVQQLARGLSDDVDILTWLHKRIWPYESNLSEQDSYVSTLLTSVEQIRNGVTTMADAGLHHAAASVRAVVESGLRADLCYSIMDEGEGLPKSWQISTDECIARQEEAFAAWHGYHDGRIRWFFGLRTLMNNSDELVRRTHEAARRLGTRIHMHVAEGPAETDIITASRGTTTVRHLHNLGLLGPDLLAVHCVSVDEEERALFRKHDVKVSHNPAAALRVMGLAPISEYVEDGICVSIATDGAPSNCRNSLVDEMYLAAVLQKGRRVDPSAMPATQVLAMVTIDAARCLGLENEIGSLEIGKRADLCVINPRTPEMLPLHDPISNLVFSMKPENVVHTMADGIWLMRDRKLTQIDLDALLTEAQGRADAIRTRAGIQLPKRFNWVS